MKSVIWRNILVPRQLTDPKRLEARLAGIDAAKTDWAAEIAAKVAEATEAEHIRLAAKVASAESNQKAALEIMKRVLDMEPSAKVAIAAAEKEKANAKATAEAAAEADVSKLEVGQYHSFALFT